MISNTTRSFKEAIGLLNRKQSIKGVKLFILLTFNMVIDLMSLASIFPILFVLSNPVEFEKSSIAQTIYLYFSFESVDSFLRSIIIFVFLLFLGKTIFSYFVTKWKASFTHDLAGELTGRLYAKLLNEENLKEYDDNSGDIINKIINLPALFTTKIIGAYIDLLVSLILGISIITFLSIYNSQVFVYLAVVLLPVALLYFYFQNRALNSSKEDFKIQRPLLIQRIFESRMGRLDIVLSGGGQYFKNKMTAANHKYQNALKKHNTAINSTNKNIEFIAVFGVCLLFFGFTFYTELQEDMFMILSVYTLATYRLIPALSKVGTSFSEINVHQFVVEELYDFLSDKEKNMVEQSARPVKFEQCISIKKIGYKYPNSSFAIKAFTADFNKHEKIALIGSSGCGKTTLIKLLLGILESQSGFIEVDSTIVNKQNLSMWRQNIAYVSQDPFLFEATLFDNIAMGQDYSAANISRVRAILKLLELSDFGDDSQLGLNMNVGENGSKLSGGQKQRIAIARALFQDKPFLIFDEVTSNLDEENRQKVLENIVKVASLNKTILFVTHQPDIINLCDKTIDMEQYNNTARNNLG